MIKTHEPLQVAIVALSGRGKTFSFRNCNPDNFGFINAENKPLPFENKFKFYEKPSTWQEMVKSLIDFGKNEEVDAVGFDSMSAYLDDLMDYCLKTKSGYEIYNLYNAEVGKFLKLIKRYPKNIFVTAHYESTENEDGVMEVHIKTKGKGWKGQIEREFTAVMFAEAKMADGDNREYYFNLNSDGRTSAKTPPYLFGEGVSKVPNDVNEVLIKIKEKQT